MRAIEECALRAYREQFGSSPSVVVSAPGRVNLIGEHTDYNGGFVLPCAVNRRVAVALGPGDGELYSADYADRRTVPSERVGSWADYPGGIAWAFSTQGLLIPPFQAAFAGDVPRGAGLSSSAAIEAATVLALAAWQGLTLDRTELAQLCQRGENGFVGVNSGIMDQYASLLCRAGAALLIDCESLAAEHVPLDLAPASLELLICDTRAPRTLGATGYNARRESCERAARALGLALLRDAATADLVRLEDTELRQRARHVITENARVLTAVDALRRSDFAAFGALMFASHASLRDDFAVSTPELDTFVEAAAEAGALGARLTGAGFGGCAIALSESRLMPRLRALVEQRFAARDFQQPAFYTAVPAPGAEVVST